MGLFERIGLLLRANVNAILTRNEDPEQLIALALEDMRGQLIAARSQVGLAIADERRLQKELEATLYEASQWEEKAMISVRAGNDHLARQALERREEHRRQAAEWGEQLQKQHQAVEELKRALRLLNDRIDETRRHKNLLMARLQRAEAQKQIQMALHGARDVSVFDVLERLSNRVDRVESEAEAEEVLSLEASGDPLSRQIEALATPSIEDSLAELKLRMGVEDQNRAALPHEEMAGEPVPVGGDADRRRG